MIQLTKQQAAKALGVSLRSLAYKMKSGEITFTKIAGAKVGQQAVFFSYADLRLSEPSATPAPIVHDVPINKQYEDEPASAPRPVNSIEQRENEDAAFAQAYLRGEATDSCGNTITGNERWPTKGKVTALGPIEPVYNPPPDTTAHMTPGTFGGTPMIGVDGEPIAHAGSPNHPMNSEAFYEAWRKPGQPSYQELHNIQVKLPHPNATRNDYLKAIWIDIHNGWSR